MGSTTLRDKPQGLLPKIPFSLKSAHPALNQPVREIVTLGDHIWKVRTERNELQKDVARFIGVTKYTISHWETNLDAISAKNVPKVIEYLGYNPLLDNQELTYAQRVKNTRLSLGLTKEQLAKRALVALNTIDNIETGRTKKPRKWIYEKLDKVFSVYSL